MISVIVPVYNTAKYLPQCLNSILSPILRKDASAIYEIAVRNNKSQRFVRTAKKVISKVCQILQ